MTCSRFAHRYAAARDLFGLGDTGANGAQHSAAGSIALAELGLPFAANLAPRGELATDGCKL